MTVDTAAALLPALPARVPADGPAGFHPATAQAPLDFVKTLPVGVSFDPAAFGAAMESLRDSIHAVLARYLAALAVGPGRIV